MDKQSEIKQRVEHLLIKEPRSYADLARQIGIAPASMVSFMKGRRQTSVLVLSMIERYLIERERNDE